MARQKIIIIVGPTASGKSALAVRLAEEFNGEVVSADSRQVYRGLDIGTGKISYGAMKGIPHHLIDVTRPRHVFTAADYVKKARRVIRGILGRNKLPIVAGGTGFYIDALLGTRTLATVPPDKKLRKTLLKETTGSLVKKLERLAPARVKTIDTKNRRRLIRAIEIASATAPNYTYGRSSVCIVRGKSAPMPPSYSALKIGSALPREELKQKISARLRARLRSGMIEEAKRLHKEGLSYARMEELGLEYRYLARYLQNKISKKDMLSQLETAIGQYAKRQMTWWRRDKTIQWFNSEDYRVIQNTVYCFLESCER